MPRVGQVTKVDKKFRKDKSEIISRYFIKKEVVRFNKCKDSAFSSRNS